jgi:hypothetical protein
MSETLTLGQDTATSYAKQWESLAFSYDHVTSTYGNTASWGFLYNLYLPSSLGQVLFSQNVGVLTQTLPCFLADYSRTQIYERRQHGMPLGLQAV